MFQDVQLDGEIGLGGLGFEGCEFKVLGSLLRFPASWQKACLQGVETGPNETSYNAKGGISLLCKEQ